MTKKDYDEIFTKLLELFPKPDTELNYQTPFQLLVAVMLSAQTTDKQVNVVTDNLFLKVKNFLLVHHFYTKQYFLQPFIPIHYYNKKSLVLHKLGN